MDALERAIAADPRLASELATLTPQQRALLREELALREKAERISALTGLDPSEVVHQLKQLRRSPVERLRRGLAGCHCQAREPDA